MKRKKIYRGELDIERLMLQGVADSKGIMKINLYHKAGLSWTLGEKYLGTLLDCRAFEIKDDEYYLTPRGQALLGHLNECQKILGTDEFKKL